MSDKLLVSRIYKEFFQINNKKTNNWILEIDKRLGARFTKDYKQVANKHMKSCPTSLVIRKMQVKTVMRYCFTPTRITTTKKSGSTKCWQ